jgi:hypothetical protein
MTRPLLQQCRDALALALSHIDALEERLRMDTPEQESFFADSLSVGEKIAGPLAAIDAELARTDVPSEAQVKAAMLVLMEPWQGKSSADGPMAFSEWVRNILTAAGVRAPRVVVPKRFAHDSRTGPYQVNHGGWMLDDDVIKAVRAAGGVPVDAQGKEIK